VLVPHVSSVEMAQSVLRAARFTPRGDRGANPYVRAAGYGTTPDWLRAANESVVVMLMVEGTDGIAAMPGIVGLDGLDAVFLGPVDLSHALGVPGQVDHPEVVSALEKVAVLGAEHGVPPRFSPPTRKERRRGGAGRTTGGLRRRHAGDRSRAHAVATAAQAR